MEITAKEIERQASRIDEQAERYYNTLSRITNSLRISSDIVRSTEDSDLSRKLQVAADQCHYTKNSAKKKFHELSAIMHKYASDTIANEERSSENISTISNNIEELNSSISNIDTGN